MLHPEADKRGDILVRFLFEGRDQIGKVEPPSSPGREHVTKGIAKSGLAVAFPKGVKEKKTLGTEESGIFRLLLWGVPRDEA